MALRDGGRRGYEVAFHGEYREIVAEERIVTTEVYEAMPESEALNIVKFSEADGRTTVTLLMQLESKDVRDMILSSGMEVGMQEQLDLLEAVAIALG